MSNLMVNIQCMVFVHWGGGGGGPGRLYVEFSGTKVSAYKDLITVDTYLCINLFITICLYWVSQLQ